MQLVKGILESTEYVGETFLTQPPDTNVAAGHAAGELCPRFLALLCW